MQMNNKSEQLMQNWPQNKSPGSRFHRKQKKIILTLEFEVSGHYPKKKNQENNPHASLRPSLKNARGMCPFYTR